MTTLVALDNQAHRELRVSARYSVEAEVNLVSVVPREFPRLLAHYPIFFSQNPASGKFEPAVLLGFDRGENLFLREGVWDAEYVPLQLARQPFALLPRHDPAKPDVPASLDIALDPASPRLQDPDGERLFLNDGSPSKHLQNLVAMLKALVSGTSEAYAFTGRLAELNLLEPVRIDVQFVDGSDARVEGVHWVAAEALKALPAEQLVELRDRGFLEWLYFQMASLAQMANLVARRNRGLAAREPPAETDGSGSA